MTHFYRRQPPRGAKVASGSPLGRGITAHFPFNGTLASSARSRGRAPVVTAGPALRAGAAGWFVQGNGSGRILYPDLLPSAMGVAGASPRTIVAEFYMGDTSAPKCVFSFGDTSAGMRTQFTLLTNNQYRSVQLATYGNDVNYSPFSTGGTGAKVFLVVAYDGNTTLTFRSWSKLDSTGEVVFNSQTSTLGGPLNTGNTVPLNLMGGGTYGFASMVTALYHLSIYGGKCLTPAEMDRLYADRHQVMAQPQAFPFGAVFGNAAVPDTRVAGDAVAVASWTGTLSTAVPLAAASSCQASAAGSLTTGVRLAGGAAAAATASGVLSTSISLTGIAAAVASAAGTVAVGGAGLAGAVQAIAAATGALGTGISLSGIAAAQTVAAGQLAGAPVSLDGAATAKAAGGGELSTGIMLTGVAGSSGLGAGTLKTGIVLAGAGAATAGAGGTLTVGVAYARAPAGSGYTPQKLYSEHRSAAVSAPRPAVIQRNNR